MIPLICDIPTMSNIEIDKQPSFEYTSLVTTLVSNKKTYMLSDVNYSGISLGDHNYLDYLGTTIKSSSILPKIILQGDRKSFFDDDYDVVIKLPESKSIIMKMKVKVVSDFSPKIFL